MENNVKIIKNEALFADADEILSAGGNVSLRVKGHSMRPFLRNGRDLVELSPISAGALRRGMVVLFRHKGRHILHRIRRISGDRLTIKGDGNHRMTEYASREDVVAYVLAAERDGQRIDYGSPRWRQLSARSLSAKAVRTVWNDIKKIAKKILRVK